MFWLQLLKLLIMLLLCDDFIISILLYKNLVVPKHLGWLGKAKVSFILRHRGVQLTAGQGLLSLQQVEIEEECFYFFFFFTFIYFPFSPVPLFHPLYYSFCLSSPFLWETTQNDLKGLTCH